MNRVKVVDYTIPKVNVKCLIIIISELVKLNSAMIKSLKGDYFEADKEGADVILFMDGLASVRWYFILFLQPIDFIAIGKQVLFSVALIK